LTHTNYKKTETKENTASLKEQVDGEKVSALSGTNPIAAAVSAAGKPELKPTETKEHSAPLADQLAGEKVTGLKGTNPIAAAIP